jgi:hypothetical protein
MLCALFIFSEQQEQSALAIANSFQQTYNENAEVLEDHDPLLVCILSRVELD